MDLIGRHRSSGSAAEDMDASELVTDVLVMKYQMAMVEQQMQRITDNSNRNFNNNDSNRCW